MENTMQNELCDYLTEAQCEEYDSWLAEFLFLLEAGEAELKEVE